MTPRAVGHVALGAVLGGLVLLALHPVSRFYPACPVYAYLHVLCPGCGATRALAALLRGDWAAAWRWNALFVGALPLLGWFGAVSFRRATQDRSFVWPQVSSRTLGLLAGVTLLFTVARNL